MHCEGVTVLGIFHFMNFLLMKKVCKSKMQKSIDKCHVHIKYGSLKNSNGQDFFSIFNLVDFLWLGT